MENKQLNIAKAVWWEEGRLYLLDQTTLPQYESVLEIDEPEELISAIQQLSVRGAPALGVAGAYGVLLIAKDWKNNTEPPDWDSFAADLDALKNARPTAINLKWAINRVTSSVQSQNPKTKKKAYALLEKEARSIHEEDEKRCRQIGAYGADLLSESSEIVTHCNTGALATGGIGTALGVIYSAVMQGKQVHVYADETRPLLQGARLTAWELQKANIPVTVMTDGMAASLMTGKNINCVIVGADRIANNGDTANKIGTYQLAIAAKAHDVPFYIAAPTSTIDITLDSGSGIPIEMRDGDEVIRWGDILTAPQDTAVFSPAFDVTPSSYITGIITDVGVAYPPFDFRDFFEKNNVLES